MRSQPDRRPLLEDMVSEMNIEWQENVNIWAREAGKKKA